MVIPTGISFLYSVYKYSNMTAMLTFSTLFLYLNLVLNASFEMKSLFSSSKHVSTFKDEFYYQCNLQDIFPSDWCNNKTMAAIE